MRSKGYLYIKKFVIILILDIQHQHTCTYKVTSVYNKESETGTCPVSNF